MLRSILLATLISTMFIACSPEKDNHVFSIEGKVQNIYPGNVLLYRATDLNRKIYDVMDTIKIGSDSTFFTNFTLEPHHYLISFYDSLTVPIIADSGQQIKIHFFSDKKYDVSGSDDTDLFEEYEEFRTEILRRTVYPVRGQLYQLRARNDPKDADRIAELGKQQLEAEKNYKDTLINFVRTMGPSLALYPTTVRWEGDDNIPFYKGLADEVSEKYKGLKIASQFQEKVRLMSQVAYGGKVSEITAPDSTGINIDLYSSMGSYTLIDFWGSWCSPCRTESPHLNKLYDQYRDRGFEIYGVAFERNRYHWTKAIERDNRRWPNVSDLNGYQNETAFQYSVTSLPKNFLVDKDGRIVGKDLHGEELTNKLTELF